MLVKVGAYIGYFASEIIRENIRNLTKQVVSRKRRTFFTGTLPVADTEKVFAGGAIGYLNTVKSVFGIMDDGSSNKAFCSRVYCL